METRRVTDIAEEWIEKWSGDQLPAIGAGVSDSALDWELPREQPDVCLAAICEVLNRISCAAPSRLLSVLAAGPLEELLKHNGEAVLDQVDLLARRDPAFRLLLNGVWDSSIKPSVLAKLANYRSNPW